MHQLAYPIPNTLIHLTPPASSIIPLPCRSSAIASEAVDVHVTPTPTNAATTGDDKPIVATVKVKQVVTPSIHNTPPNTPSSIPSNAPYDPTRSTTYSFQLLDNTNPLPPLSSPLAPSSPHFPLSPLSPQQRVQGVLPVEGNTPSFGTALMNAVALSPTISPEPPKETKLPQPQHGHTRLSFLSCANLPLPLFSVPTYPLIHPSLLLDSLPHSPLTHYPLSTLPVSSSRPQFGPAIGCALWRPTTK